MGPAFAHAVRIARGVQLRRLGEPRRRASCSVAAPISRPDESLIFNDSSHCSTSTRRRSRAPADSPTSRRPSRRSKRGWRQKPAVARRQGTARREPGGAPRRREGSRRPSRAACRNSASSDGGEDQQGIPGDAERDRRPPSSEVQAHEDKCSSAWSRPTTLAGGVKTAEAG